MHRIDTANARPDANGTGKAGYHLNNDLVGADPTNLDPAALNAIQEEICSVIEFVTYLSKGTNNQLFTAINWMITSQMALGTASIAINAIYPVGITVEFALNVDPNLLWAGTTWVRFAQGKTTVGYQSGDPDFGTIGQTGGEKTHQLTIPEIPAHHHDYEKVTGTSYAGDSGSGGGNAITAITSSPTSDTGGNQAHNNLQPYVVTAKWLRTA